MEINIPPFFKNYKILNILSKTSNKIELLVENHIINKSYLLKYYLKSFFINLDHFNSFKSALIILKTIHHQNISELILFHEEDEIIYTLYDFIEGNSLKDLIIENGSLMDSAIQNIIYQIV